MQQLFNIICPAVLRRNLHYLLLGLLTAAAACEGPAGTGDSGSTGGASGNAAVATGGGSSAAPAVQTGSAGTGSTVLYTTDTGYRSGYSTDSSSKK